MIQAIHDWQHSVHFPTITGTGTPVADIQKIIREGSVEDLVDFVRQKGRHVVNLKGLQGLSPLHVAVAAGRPDMTKALIGLNADIHNNDGVLKSFWYFFVLLILPVFKTMYLLTSPFPSLMHYVEWVFLLTLCSEGRQCRMRRDTTCL